MPVYNIFEQTEKEDDEELVQKKSPFSEDLFQHGASFEKGSLFASIAARLFFFMLLIADLAWGVWTLFALLGSLCCHLLLGCKCRQVGSFLQRRYLNLKRSSLCALALLISLFSPALGMMVACSYFLMYDKKGVQEIVPSVLQEQFQELLGAHPHAPFKK